MLDASPLLIATARRILPGAFWAGDGSAPEVALTFDDGPDPEHTLRLVEALDRLDVPGTFFWLGSRLDLGSEAIGRVVAAGHEVGIHGDCHAPFWGRSDAELRAALDSVRARIAALSGLHEASIRDVRPPFGAIRRRQIARLREWGYRTVLCDVLPADWAEPSPTVVARILRRSRPGSLIALHDGGKAGRSVVRTVEAVVPRLRDRGLRFVTVEQLARREASPDRPDPNPW